MKIIKWSSVIVIIPIIIVIILALFQEYKYYKKSESCLKELINLGIERKNIITNNGECYVKSPN